MGRSVPVRTSSLDGGNQLRVTIGAIFGIKKMQFGTPNKTDYATITLSSYETLTA